MRRWIVTYGGSGMAPVGPGTAASLATSITLLLIYVVLSRENLVPTALLWNSILLALVVGFSAMSVGYGPWAIEFYGRKDPGPFVLDECAGICLTMLMLPRYAGWREAIAVTVGFLAFRIFDIIKPWPCPRLEKLPGGWGILMDDLMAAVYANILSQLCLRFGERFV
jgi:phosphatidylglycerophosphatase A